MKLVKTKLQVSVATVVRRKDENLLFIGDCEAAVVLQVLEYVRIRANFDTANVAWLAVFDANQSLNDAYKVVNAYFEDREDEYLEHLGSVENIWTVAR
jgi:hypothetical protein